MTVFMPAAVINGAITVKSSVEVRTNVTINGGTLDLMDDGINAASTATGGLRFSSRLLVVISRLRSAKAMMKCP